MNNEEAHYIQNAILAARVQQWLPPVSYWAANAETQKRILILAWVCELWVYAFYGVLSKPYHNRMGWSFLFQMDVSKWRIPTCHDW